jgi:hypothetical protein
MNFYLVGDSIINQNHESSDSNGADFNTFDGIAGTDGAMISWFFDIWTFTSLITAVVIIVL